MPESTSDYSDDGHSRRGFNRLWTWAKRGEKVGNRHGKKTHGKTRWQYGTAWINHQASKSKRHRRLGGVKCRSERLRVAGIAPFYNQSA